MYPELNRLYVYDGGEGRFSTLNARLYKTYKYSVNGNVTKGEVTRYAKNFVVDGIERTIFVISNKQVEDIELDLTEDDRDTFMTSSDVPVPLDQYV
jgi:hypothetical protein